MFLPTNKEAVSFIATVVFVKLLTVVSSIALIALAIWNAVHNPSFGPILLAALSLATCPVRVRAYFCCSRVFVLCFSSIASLFDGCSYSV